MVRSKSRQRLLIAEVSPDDLKILKTMLAADYDIEVTANGQETMRLALSPKSPGLILLNNMNSTSDLYEILRHLKTNPTTRNIPIIILSEPTPEDTEAKGYGYGSCR